MKENFEKFIIKSCENPKKEEVKEILDYFKLKTLKKGKLYKEPFKTSKDIGFLIDGSLRLIFHKNDGTNLTVRLFEKNNFVTDTFSARSQTMTPISIECIEDSKLLLASLSDINKLLKTNLTLNILFREYITERALELGRSYLLFLTGNAEDRYQYIIKNNPDLLNKFPLSYIASIIGVTPTQLSRIRNKK